jgi:tetratricopeptide (TPR) repeat protein
MFKKKPTSDNLKTGEQKTSALADFIKNKAKSVFDFTINHFDVVKKELELIKTKSQNLLESNYQLGLRHLEKGNLGDAIFRFRFIKKFWPNHYDAYIQLANCYIIKKRYNKALLVLHELTIINPTYENQAQELIKKIEDLQLSSDIK